MARRPRRQQPVFVGRESYRVRRWRDAARMLPVLGLVLWLVPLLWPPGTTGNAMILIHVFAVWAFLVAAARVIAPRARPDLTEDGDEPA